MHGLTFFKNRAKLSFFALLNTASLTQTTEGTNICTFKYMICSSSPTQSFLNLGLPAHCAYQGQETWSGLLRNKFIMREVSSSFPVIEFHLCPEAQEVKPKDLQKVGLGFFSVVWFSNTAEADPAL